MLAGTLPPARGVLRAPVTTARGRARATTSCECSAGSLTPAEAFLLPAEFWSNQKWVSQSQWLMAKEGFSEATQTGQSLLQFMAAPLFLLPQTTTCAPAAQPRRHPSHTLLYVRWLGKKKTMGNERSHVLIWKPSALHADTRAVKWLPDPAWPSAPLILSNAISFLGACFDEVYAQIRVGKYLGSFRT